MLPVPAGVGKSTRSVAWIIRNLLKLFGKENTTLNIKQNAGLIEAIWILRC